MAENPRDKAAPKGPQPKPASNEPGHLGLDDRGNVTWAWSEEGDLTADDTLGNAERVRALVDPSLKVADDDASDRGIRQNAKGLKSGYNPYDSGVLGKSSWKKGKNLRDLSKWIELRKKMQDKKGE